MNKTIKITVRFPKKIQLEMRQALIESGYSLTEKSRWAEEAINTFLNLPNYHEYIDIGEEIGEIKLEGVESFYLSVATSNKIEDAIMQLRKRYPMLEGVKSTLIRTSVIQRLLRPTSTIS